jgi:type IV pilus assembly protein PilA
MRRDKGFSLIELLIVVAIILIIAGVAVPSFLRSRLLANESSAVASVRTLNTAQVSYNSAYPTVGFASVLTSLAGTCTGASAPTSTGACLIDSTLSSGTKNGYVFALSGASGSPATAYQVVASPTGPNQTGVHYFCSYADAVVRVSMSAIPTCDGTVTPQQ